MRSKRLLRFVADRAAAVPCRDDPARGTHDGTLDGVRRFHCVRAGSGSFVRPGKVLLGTTFAHEFLQRYNSEGL